MSLSLEGVSENAWARSTLGYNGSPNGRAELVLPFVLTGGPLELRPILRSNVNGRVQASLSGTSFAATSIDADTWQRRRLVGSAPGFLAEAVVRFVLEPGPEATGVTAVPEIEVRQVGVRSERPLFLGPRGLAALMTLPLIPALLIDLRVRSRRVRWVFWSALAIAVLALARAQPLLALIHWPPLAGLATIGVAGLLWGPELAVRAWTAATEMQRRHQAGCPRVAAVVLAALPAAVVSIWLATALDTNLLRFSPATPNDEILYWHETATFARWGWSGGYYVVREQPASWSFIHFGAHGPAFPALYGLVGRLAGWHEFSGPLFHLVFLAAGLSTYALLARPSPFDLALCAVLVATYWPLLLYIPSNLQEGLHFALAAAAAGVISRLLAARPDFGRRAYVTLGGITAYAVLSRPSWGLLLPLFILLARFPTRRARWIGFGLLAAVGAGLFWVFAQTASPFPQGGFLFVNGLQSPALLASNIRSNLEHLTTGNPLERAQWIQWLSVVSMAAAGLALGARGERSAWAVHLLNLGVLAPMIVVFYTLENEGAFRILGVGLFLSLLVIAANRSKLSRLFVAGQVAIQLAVAPAFSNALASRARCFPRTPDRIAAFRGSVGARLHYVPGASPWCNTLLAAHFPYYFREFVAVPPGIGITMMFPTDHRRLRSKYVLLDTAALAANPEASLRSLGNEEFELSHPGIEPARLERLAITNVGSLYRNRDTACPE